LKGHERSITHIKYNREGDLIFTTSKHPTFAVWFTENGERLGTFEGHTGAVWSLDVDRHTDRIVTGAADNYVKVWKAELGKELFSITHKAPVRSVSFALGDRQIVSVTDQVLGYLPTLYIYDLNSPATKPILEFTGKNEAKLLQAQWGPLNETIFTANEDGTVRIYDTRNGKQLHVISDHARAVMQVNFSKDGSHFCNSIQRWYLKTVRL